MTLCLLSGKTERRGLRGLSAVASKNIRFYNSWQTGRNLHAAVMEDALRPPRAGA